MKKRNVKYFPKVMLFVIAILVSQNLFSQIRVSGKVTTETGESIPGVSIVEKGTINGVITNLDGEYQIGLKSEKEPVLIFSFIGMQSQEIPVNGKDVINVVLNEVSTDLEEVVIVGYGTQKRESVVGSISTTSADEIMKAPVGNVSSALVGRLSGLTSMQSSGQPGGDAPVLRIRGVSTLNDAEPLIIVDGIERNGGGRASFGSSGDVGTDTFGNFSGFESLNPNDIESVSILKDASATAVYGVKGANGVIIITTKKGRKGQKAVISYTGNYGVTVPVRLKDNISSADYGMYANEGGYNDGTGAFMSFLDINKYRYNYNPILYPSISYKDFMVKDMSSKHTHNLSIRGGTDKVTYFSSIGYYDEDGIIKSNPGYGFDANNHYNRLNIRSNIDFQFTNRFSASINIDGRFEVRRGPNAPNDKNMWWKMYNALPWVSPGFDEEGRYIKTNEEPDRPVFQWIYERGIYRRNQTTVNTVFSAKHELDFITPGLSAQGKFSFDSFVDTPYKRTYNTLLEYIPLEIGDEVYLKKQGKNNQLSYVQGNASKRKKEYYEASLNYLKSFGDHTVSALALYNQQKTYYKEAQFRDVPHAYLGFVSRVTYNYKSKYFGEFNFGLNGSENFPEGKRFGKFPAFSGGWLLSEEAFMKNIKPISYFKIRGSVGLVGSDRIGNSRFLYIPGVYKTIHAKIGPYFGEPSTGAARIPGLQEGTAANNDVTWETALKSNIGIDSKFFNDKLSVTVDLFKENRDNILTTMQTYPLMSFPYMGGPAVAPGGPGWPTADYKTRVNYAQVENKGIEVELEWNGKIGSDFNYFIKGSYAYSINKAVKLSESSKDYPWLYAEGLPLGNYSGLIADGYWDSYEEINNPNNPYNVYNPNPIPGDIKYKDINGDLRIDDQDNVNLGYGDTPRTTITGALGFGYKGFEVSALMQGATDVMYHPWQESMIQMYKGSGGFDWIEDRWTPQNRDASYPVLHSLANTTENAGNFRRSSYWGYDATYIRLKNVEIAYRFPKKFVNKIGLGNLRMFLTGQNLFTWTPTEEMERYDPEAVRTRMALHPLMQVYNLGLSVTF
jgi:TonB-linked SusC/RagA family outer membrane protein